MLHGTHVMPDTCCSVLCYGKSAAALLQPASAIPGDTQLLPQELKAGVSPGGLGDLSLKQFLP